MFVMFVDVLPTEFSRERESGLSAGQDITWGALRLAFVAVTAISDPDTGAAWTVAAAAADFPVTRSGRS